ncbi:MAG: flagellar protein [Fusobacteria bacterium]|nr:flagellar protein [Fusobacteriota bacterium]
MVNIINNPYFNGIKIEKLKNESNNNFNNSSNSKVEGKSFQEIMDEKTELKFSGHAVKRLKDRNIEISDSEILKLKNGIEKIKEKGGQESVILFEEKAFVVSVKNNTVVTVMDGNNLKENVFTNIDSMLII